MRHRKAGFTLVELLVVMSILSVLASLLLPALTKAREQAMQAYCANNIRQCALQLLIYAEDFDGIIPTRGAESTGGWESASFYCTVYPDFNKAPAPHWLCPTRPNQTNEPFYFRQTRKTYATFLRTEANGKYCLRPKKMKKTSKTPLVLDSLATDGRMYGIIWSALGGYIGMMHNNSSNVCFADGHAGVLDIVGWSDHEALQNHYVYPSQTWDMPKVLYRTDYSTPVPLP